MKKFLKLSFIPQNFDFGLLLLRIFLGFSLFYKHGIEKIFSFSEMQTHFPDPLHIGATPGLIYAMLSDGICSILIILGLATRLAALMVAFNLFVVFAFLHGFSFVDGHAELVYAYLGGFLTILITGPGKYSMDNKLLS